MLIQYTPDAGAMKSLKIRSILWDPDTNWISVNRVGTNHDSLL